MTLRMPIILKRSLLLALLAAVTACGPNGARSLKAGDGTPAPGTSTPAPDANLADVKTVGIGSGGGVNVVGTQGSRANIQIGAPTSQIYQKTSGGYKVFLSVAGQLNSAQ